MRARIKKNRENIISVCNQLHWRVVQERKKIGGGRMDIDRE
jgi:hypothetical protein